MTGQQGTPDEVDGQDAMRYRMMVPADQIDDPFFEALAEQEGIEEVEVHVWVGDDEGHVLRMAYDLGGSPTIAQPDDNGTATDDDNGTATDGDNGTATNGDTEGAQQPGATPEPGAQQQPDQTEPGEGQAGTTPARPGMAGTGMDLAVMVDLDDLGGVDEIEVPEQDEVQMAEAADLQALWAQVRVIESAQTTGPGTTTPAQPRTDTDTDTNGDTDTGTGTGTTGDDDTGTGTATTGDTDTDTDS
jgi:hypothetical protein